MTGVALALGCEAAPRDATASPLRNSPRDATVSGNATLAPGKRLRGPRDATANLQILSIDRRICSVRPFERVAS